MTDNLEIWNKLKATDPKHTKAFKRAGGFTGTAVKPIYSVQKMTEEFGPVGIGWGMTEPKFKIVPGVNQEVMVYCTLGVWLKASFADGGGGIFYGVGGDKIVSHVRANEQYKRPERWENDDEAFKKAFTDALTNAMKHLGMSADVHMGLFDDSKYVQEREREERAQEAPSEPVQPLPVPAKTGLKDTAQRALWGRLVDATRKCQTWEEFNTLWDHQATMAAYDGFSQDWKNEMDNEVNDKTAELEQKFGKFTVTPPTAAESLDRLELTQAQKLAGTP